MEFLADIFWTVLVGLWFINQFRRLNKRQSSIAAGETWQEEEESADTDLGDLVESVEDWVFMNSSGQSDGDNLLEPWESRKAAPTPTRSLLDVFTGQYVTSESISESEGPQSNPLVVESTPDSEALNDPYPAIQRRVPMREARQSRLARIAKKKGPLERKSLIPYLTGGDVKQLKRAIVLSEVFGPPLSMRKPEGQFSGPID